MKIIQVDMKIGNDGNARQVVDVNV